MLWGIERLASNPHNKAVSRGGFVLNALLKFYFRLFSRSKKDANKGNIFLHGLHEVPE